MASTPAETREAARHFLENTDDGNAADFVTIGQLKSVCRALLNMGASEERSSLLDRMQDVRMLWVDNEHAVQVGGRFDGWLMWKHPDGQWVSMRRLVQERPDLKAEGVDERPPSTEGASTPPLLSSSN